MAAFLKFNAMRLGLLLVVFAVLQLLDVSLGLSIVLAAVISAALSYVLLRGPREELAAVIVQRAGRRPRRDAVAEDAAAEDAIAGDAVQEGLRKPSRREQEER